MKRKRNSSTNAVLRRSYFEFLSTKCVLAVKVGSGTSCYKLVISLVCLLSPFTFLNIPFLCSFCSDKNIDFCWQISSLASLNSLHLSLSLSHWIRLRRDTSWILCSKHYCCYNIIFFSPPFIFSHSKAAILIAYFPLDSKRVSISFYLITKKIYFFKKKLLRNETRQVKRRRCWQKDGYLQISIIKSNKISC